MSVREVDVEVRADGGQARERFRAERRKRVVGVEDDMWAQLAEDATPLAIAVDGSVGGYCTIDDEHQLRSFHVTDGLEIDATDVLGRVVGSTRAVAALPSTVDPLFVTSSLATGGRARPVALMYEHLAEPTAQALEMRLARDDDHESIVSFDHEQTASPHDFLEPYLAARIGLGELAILVDGRGRIAATGECRTDTRSNGHAHVGLIVRAGERGRGIGRGVLAAMVELAKRRDLRPLCSTEPDNIAARHVIHRAGFRVRHSVVRVDMPSSDRATRHRATPA